MIRRPSVRCRRPALTAALVLLLSCVAAPAWAAVTWDGDAGNGLWSDPLNWSGDVVPQSGDAIQLAGDIGTVHLDVDFTVGASLDVGTQCGSCDYGVTLVVDPGVTLTVAAAGGGLTIMHIGRVVNEGTIAQVQGEVNLYVAWNGAPGGAELHNLGLIESGATLRQWGGLFVNEGTFASTYAFRFRGGAFRNVGAMTLDGSYVVLDVANSSENGRVFTNEASGTISGTARIVVGKWNGPAGADQTRLVNHGAIAVTKPGTLYNFEVYAIVENHGTIDVTGTMLACEGTLLGAGTLTGPVKADCFVWTGGGATDAWSDGANWVGGLAPASGETKPIYLDDAGAVWLDADHVIGGDFTVRGSTTLVVAPGVTLTAPIAPTIAGGATLDVRGGVVATVPWDTWGVLLISGTFQADEAFGAPGSLTVEAGGLLVTGGPATVSALDEATVAGTWQMAGGGTVAGSLLVTGTLDNDGPLSIEGTLTNEGTIDNAGALSIEGTLTNEGSLDTAAGETIIECAGTLEGAGAVVGAVLVRCVDWDGDGGDGLWSNPLNWTGDQLPSSVSTIRIVGDVGPVLVDVDVTIGGTLEIGTQWSSSPYTTPVAIAPGVTVTLDAPDAALNVMHTGRLLNQGTLAITDGELSVFSAYHGAEGGGELRNEGGLALTDTLRQWGGTITNVGTVICTGALRFRGGVFRNEGAIDLDTGYVLVLVPDSSADLRVFTNAAVGTIGGTGLVVVGDWQHPASYADSTLRNEGTLQIAAGSFYTTQSIRNYATIENFGALDVTGGGIDNADGTIRNGCGATIVGPVSGNPVVALPCDETPPVVTTPGPATAESGPSGAVVTFAASAVDAEDGPVPVTCAPPSGSTFAVGTTTVACVATDVAGNVGSASFEVTVLPPAPPVVTPPGAVTVEANGDGEAVVDYGAASAVDAEDGPVPVTCTPPSGGTFAVGTTTVACVATDAAGNVGSASFEVTVLPPAPPVVTPPAAVTVEAAGADGAVATYGVATAVDAVDGPLPATCAPASGTLFPLGTTSVVCAAVDAAGNEGSATFPVTVVDTTPPTVFPPPDVVAEADGPDGRRVSLGMTYAMDLVDGDLRVTCVPTGGSVFPVGTTTVVCTASDAAGNVGSATATVTVVDTTPPVVTAPANQVVAATGPDGAAVAYPPASAWDIVDGALPAVCAPASGSVFPVGVSTVVCEATDGAGNTASAAFTVAVIDTTPPVVSPPADIAAAATSPAGAVVTWPPVAAHDAVDGPLPTTCAPPSGSVFPLGVTPVVCSAVDAAGNTGSATFLVGVVDTTPPVIDVVAPTAHAVYPVGVALDFAAADAVSGVASVEGRLTALDGTTAVVAPGHSPAPGVHTLVVVAVDGAGNVAESDPIPFVVFDPAGGFATGGGWVEAPDAPAAGGPAGKATFGFEVRYRAGSATPVGTARIALPSADLRVRSTALDWLVVSGPYAVVEGAGVLRDGSACRFRITAVDGRVVGGGASDAVHLEVWREDAAGAAATLLATDGGDPFAPPVPLGGGSVVVHAR